MSVLIGYATTGGLRMGDQQWVRRALQAAGRTQRDLAQAWGVTEASVSRFIAGSENQDPPTSRAWTLAQVIGWEVKDVIKQLGLAGPIPDLPPAATNTETIPLGTRIFEPRETGARVAINLNVPLETAIELFRVLGAPSSPSGGTGGGGGSGGSSPRGSAAAGRRAVDL